MRMVVSRVDVHVYILNGLETFSGANSAVPISVSPSEVGLENVSINDFEDGKIELRKKVAEHIMLNLSYAKEKGKEFYRIGGLVLDMDKIVCVKVVSFGERSENI